MSWSKDYKRSIDCGNPKGFSQKAHCAGRKKRKNGGETESKSPFSEDVKGIAFSKFSHKTKHLSKSQHQLDPNLDLKQLVHHATVQYVDRDADGDVDIYDNPKKKIPDENVQSAPEGARVASKKLITKQKGELKHTRRGMAYEETKSGDEGLRDWFGKSKSSDGKSGWVQLGGKWAGKPCARQPGQTSTPKCGSSKMAANLSPEEEEKARRRKNRLDPNQPEKSGGEKPTNVRTEEMDLQEVKDKPGKGSGKKDACYNKVKSRYDVWPSAYASGALVKCRKVGAANWGTKSEEKDHEYSMARSEISTIVSAAKKLKKKMGKGEGNLEAWVQSKITKAADYIDTAADYVSSGEHNESIDIQTADGRTFAQFIDIVGPNQMQAVVNEKCWAGYKQVGMKKKGEKIVPNCVKESKSNWKKEISEEIGVKLSSPTDKAAKQTLEKIIPKYGGGKVEPPSSRLQKANFEIEGDLVEYSNWRQELGEDWQKVNKSDKTDGMSPAAVKAYRRENPGSKLKTAVTGDPKPGSKDAKRRKSFCSRSKGQQDMHNIDCSKTPDKAICKARRRWKC